MSEEANNPGTGEDFSRNPGYQLAQALQALWRENETFAQLRADHKASVEGLQQEINRLKQDILTGQKQLPLEPIPEDDTLQARVKIAQEFMDDIEEIQTQELSVLPRILDADTPDEIAL